MQGMRKGYPPPDAAHVVNTFRCAVARLSLRSDYIGYVNTESNIHADISLRVGETPASDNESTQARTLRMRGPPVCQGSGSALLLR